MSTRAIKKVIKGNIEKDGAGVKLVRILSIGTVKEFDPFLMLDIFDSTNPEDYTKGFPWHPYRGIDTVTYLIIYSRIVQAVIFVLHNKAPFYIIENIATNWYSLVDFNDINSQISRNLLRCYPALLAATIDYKIS